MVDKSELAQSWTEDADIDVLVDYYYSNQEAFLEEMDKEEYLEYLIENDLCQAMKDFKTISEIGFTEDKHNNMIIKEDFGYFKKGIHSRAEVWSWIEEEYGVSVEELIKKESVAGSKFTK